MSGVDFVGAGWSFPMRTDAAGGVALARGDREIREAVRLVLGTAFGERPMRPDFGCAIHDLVFAPADATLGGRIAYEVRASLTRWEPRIDVLDVGVVLDQSATAWITVHYQVRDTNDPRNLVFPFYFLPPED